MSDSSLGVLVSIISLLAPLCITFWNLIKDKSEINIKVLGISIASSFFMIFIVSMADIFVIAICFLINNQITNDIMMGIMVISNIVMAYIALAMYIINSFYKEKFAYYIFADISLSKKKFENIYKNIDDSFKSVSKSLVNGDYKIESQLKEIEEINKGIEKQKSITTKFRIFSRLSWSFVPFGAIIIIQVLFESSFDTWYVYLIVCICCLSLNSWLIYIDRMIEKGKISLTQSITKKHLNNYRKIINKNNQ